VRRWIDHAEVRDIQAVEEVFLDITHAIFDPTFLMSHQLLVV
jgi:hypothetical protein